MVNDRPDMPSLTGLRFFAAFFILLNHLLLGFVARDTPTFGRMLSNSAFLGMDTFFVLSGFIIHYNYSVKIDGGIFSIYNFFVARISRLYPLFILTVILDIAIVLMTGTGNNMSDIVYSIPFFLTMSQSWFYQLTHNGITLYDMYPQASIAWSVSTEMLMYASYPLLWWLLGKMKLKLSTTYWVCGFLACSFAFSLGFLGRNLDLLDAIGVKHFGQVASMQRSVEFSFAFWAWYISPYSRLLEFLSGVLVAHVFIQNMGRSISVRERLVLSLLAMLSVIYILLSFLPDRLAIASFKYVFERFGYPVVLSLLMYCSVRAPSDWLARFLSHTFFVKLGDRSYSIYILHIYFYAFVVTLPGARLLHVCLAWIAIYFVSKISYDYIEKPCRNKLRRFLASPFLRLKES